MKNYQNDSIYHGLATSSLSLFDTLAIKNACRDRLADGPSIFFRFSKILMKLGGPGVDPRTTFSIIFSTRPLWGFPGGARGRQNAPQGRQNEPQGCQNDPQSSQNGPQSVKLQQNVLPEISKKCEHSVLFSNEFRDGIRRQSR